VNGVFVAEVSAKPGYCKEPALMNRRNNNRVLHEAIPGKHISMKKRKHAVHYAAQLKAPGADSTRKQFLAFAFFLSSVLHFLLVPAGRGIYRLCSFHRSIKEINITLYPEIPLSGSRWENPQRRPPESGGTDGTGESPAASPYPSASGAAPAGSSPDSEKLPGSPPAGRLPYGISYVRDLRAAAYADTVIEVLFPRKKRRPSFREALLGKTAGTVDVGERLRSWVADEGPITGWTRPDPASEYVKKRTGQSSILALNAVRPPEEKKIEQNPARFDFIPTPLQVMAMASVYRLKEPDQVQLYSSIDPQLPVTASGFDANLEYLVKKGFLKRKKVSPELKLAVGSLFGGANIEMSRKNALNPRYEYTATVDRNTLISYFQAQIYTLNDSLRSAPPDSFQIRRTIGSLQNMIQMLIQT
jgi:hypothetical protein